MKMNIILREIIFWENWKLWKIDGIFKLIFRNCFFLYGTFLILCVCVCVMLERNISAVVIKFTWLLVIK